MPFGSAFDTPSPDFDNSLVELDGEDVETLSHFIYNPITDKLEADRAIETTLNSLFLGEQHKMSSGAENIFFTNMGSQINFFPMWGGLKDQSIVANQGSSGFIPPSGRVYTNMFSLPLGGNPDPLTSVGYSGPNYFAVNIAGLGITTTAAESVAADIDLVYFLSVNGLDVYKQILPRDAARSSAASVISPGDVIEWFFDHPVEIHAGTTIFAEIRKIDRATDTDYGVFQVRQGDTVDPNTGLFRYQAIVHNRLFEDKDLELISPYLKYLAMDFKADSTGSVITLGDLSLGAESALVSYPINVLEALANGDTITVKLKGGQKVIIESLPVNAASIDGVLVNSVLNQAIVQLNELFTNALSFDSQGNPVTGFALSGDDLTLTLADSTSYTVDVTTLGVDQNNFVASGALSGSDLVLTMDDATTVTIDASSLAVDTNTTILFGTLVDNVLTLTASDSSVVTVDVSSLALDENDYVVSGALNSDGINIDLTMDDGSVIQVPVGSLAIDNDTTITSGAVVGTDIQLTLSDSSIIIIDASSLDTGTSTQVSSGEVVGTNLVLTMADSSTVTIDASNMVNGSQLTAVNDRWYISYGANANVEVTSGLADSTQVGGTALYNQGPFYFGQVLTQGSEFRFNMTTTQQMRLGIWDGVEAATTYNGGQTAPANWGTCFTFLNGTTSFIDGSNTDVASYQTGTSYAVASGAPLVIRFDEQGHLTLLDLTGGTETIIGKTLIPLVVTSFNLQMGSWANATFPNGIISTSDWTIVHDFDSSEAGIIDGVEDHTVLRSNISIEIGEKIMFQLDEQGRNVNFGTSYTGGVSTGLATAEENLDNRFIYMTNESVNFEFSGISDWNVNTSATYYFNNSAGVDGYRKGSSTGTTGTGLAQGMFSLRFTADGELTIYSEDNNETVATAKINPTVGSSVQLYLGYTETTAYTAIPQISKQTIGQGSQPSVNFAPVVADQTVTVTEGDALSFQIVSTGNIVNQFVELDAPSWMTMNQTTGVLTGTAPAYLGTAADTIVVNCKAGNAVGGTTDFTVTVTVAEIAYTNNNSLAFGNGSTVLQGNASNVTGLARAANGAGAGDAWSISLWVYPSAGSNQESIFYFGGTDPSTNGALTIEQFSGNNLSFAYGITGNTIVAFGVGTFPLNQWNHVLVTYDGGVTGVNAADINSYLARFQMFVNGSNAISQYQHTGNGYDGSILAQEFKIGKYTTAAPRHFQGKINQVAIWDSDQSANLATIYNAGATQDLSLLAAPPAHYYEIETSVTTITDSTGSAPLTGFNFSPSDLVTDVP